MIGHFLVTLTPAQEDRVLTSPMGPGSYEALTPTRGPCLVGTAYNGGLHAWRLRGEAPVDTGWPSRMSALLGTGTDGLCVEHQYDALCHRFTVPRVNAAIRDRILTNRLWRAQLVLSLVESR